MSSPAKKFYSCAQNLELIFNGQGNKTTLYQDVVMTMKTMVETIVELLEEAQNIYWSSDYPVLREKLIVSCYQVHKILPKLIGSVRVVYQMPDNVYSKACFTFAFNETMDVIKSLEWCCESNLSSLDRPKHTSPFLNFIDIIREVGCFEQIHLFLQSDTNVEELDPILDSVLKFSVDVANASYGAEQSDILNSCQQVLKWKDDRNKTILNDIIRHLEEKVSLSIINMLIEIFWQSTQPLELLVKHVLRSTKPPGERQTRDLDVYLNHLDLYCDALSQVGRFFILNAKNNIKVRPLVTTLASLEALEVELTTAITSYYLNPSDTGCLAYLKLFKSWWCLEVEDMMQALNSVVDPVVFVQLTENKLISTVCNLKQNIETYEKQHVSKIVAEAIGQGKKVAEISVQALDSDYKLEYQTVLDRLIKALVEVRVAHKRYQQDQPDYKRKLIKCLQLLVTYVHRVCDTLPGIVSFVSSTSEASRNKTRDPSKYVFPDDYRDLPVDVGTPFKPQTMGKDGAEECFDLSKYASTSFSRKGSVRKFSMKVYDIPVDVDIQPHLDDTKQSEKSEISTLATDEATLNASISRVDELINSFMVSTDTEAGPCESRAASKTTLENQDSTMSDFSANIMADDATEQEIEEATSVLMRRLVGNMSEYSISPSSAEVSTLKRLEDLQLVQQRLLTLRDLLHDNSS